MQILAFGDSITLGFYDREGGWADRLRRFADERNLSDPSLGYTVYNLGIPGDTSTGVLERLAAEAAARVDPGEGAVILVAIGANDSQLIRKTGSVRTPPVTFRRNLEGILTAGRRFGKVVFVGLVPVDEPKVDPIPWAPEKSYKSALVKQYDALVRSFCRRNRVPFIDVYGAFSRAGHRKLLHDGVHPDSGGHKLIFGMVRDFLLKEGIL
jgi:lysophospholipase L1-like esterase